MDYVSTDYMFWLARTAWPTLCWRVLDQGIYDDSIWVKVEISWIEDGILKTAATIDGSDIKRTKKDSKIMELGNDFKGAVTEALKKLFNQALGICNDVYRMQFPELTEKQIEKLSEQFRPKAYDLAINQANYKQILKHTQT